jgi:hypothetical protein
MPSPEALRESAKTDEAEVESPAAAGAGASAQVATTMPRVRKPPRRGATPTSTPASGSKRPSGLLLDESD